MALAGQLAESSSLALTYVASFTGAGCTGNHHGVLISTLVDDQRWRALSRTLAPTILVIVSPPGADQRATAHFYHYGNAVGWCGSGLLAAAKALQLAGQRATTIATNSACYDILYHHDRLGFATKKRARWRQACDRKFWHQLFGRGFVRAWQTPESEGYTLVELNHERMVRDWKPRLGCIERHSRRALIITAKASSASRFDYVMRYFAPQYGNNEDDATGSANALLIALWSRRLGKACVRGRQFSARGGVFFGCHRGRAGVALYGQTQQLLTGDEIT